MFSKIYNLYERYEALRLIPVFFLGLTFVISFIIAGEAADNNQDVPRELGMIILVFFFTTLTGFLPVIDKIINACISYITMGEHNIEHWLGEKLFGQQYASDEHPQWRYRGKNDGLRGLIIVGMVATVSIPLTACLINPVFIPYILAPASIAGLIWGMLALARKVYYINTRLKHHVNDPNAHKE